MAVENGSTSNMDRRPGQAQQPPALLRFDMEKPVLATPPAHASELPPWMRARVQRVRLLVSTICGQLAHGCGNKACRCTACDTGRRTLDPRPTRRYTERSARATALILAAEPDARRYLCSYYASRPLPREETGHGSETQTAAAADDANERDPSSSIQHLADTAIVRDVTRTLNQQAHTDDHVSDACNSTFERELLEESRLNLTTILAGLAPLFESPFGRPGARQVISNTEAVDLVLGTLEKVRAAGPRNPRGWIPALLVDSSGNSIVVGGHTRLRNAPRALPLPAFDFSEDERLLKVILRLVDGIGARRRLEYNLTVARHNTQMESPRTAREGFLDVLMARLGTKQVAKRANKAAINEAWDLLEWLKRTFVKCWDGGTTVRGHALETMCSIFQHRRTFSIPEKFFVIEPLAGRLDANTLAEEFTGLDGNDDADGRHILHYPFVFDLTAKNTYFRAMCYVSMRRAHVEVEKAHALRRKVALRMSQTDSSFLDKQLNVALSHYLLLRVSRTDVLRDAFDQLWRRERCELRRPLRVRLGDEGGAEIGHDLGGVQIEFFNLVCRQAFASEAQLFTIDEESKMAWFQPCSLQPLHMYELLGMLFALAIYNGITLPICFPQIFYAKLLGVDGDGTALHIEDGWPALYRGLQYLLEDHLEDLDYVFPLGANGVTLEIPMTNECVASGLTAAVGKEGYKILPVSSLHHSRHRIPNEGRSRNDTATEGDLPASPPSADDIGTTWPGWHVVTAPAPPTLVTATNKTQYVRDYVDWLTSHSVQPQWDAFARGFFSCLAPHTLKIFSPAALKSVVEGSDQLDVAQLRRTTLYDGYDEDEPYVRDFWAVVEAWDAEKQRGLLKFVTAAERVPSTGVANLTFVVQRLGTEDLARLPGSSTCFGTLMLPRYPTKELLERKLSQAIELGMEGFGTG